MINGVRELEHKDLSEFWDIVVMAGGDGYFPEHKEGRIKWFSRIMDECKDVTYYGGFNKGVLRGCMAVTTRKINIRQTMVSLVGIGMVNTDMLHKKEKVCKALMEYSIQLSSELGTNMLFLSPFRPDFYKKMGFGYGTTLYRYKIRPSWFRDKGNKNTLSYMKSDNMHEFMDCYSRIFMTTHGEANKSTFFAPFSLGGGKRVVIRRCEKGVISGALVFSFGKDKSMIIHEMFYEDNETLLDFCSFLHSQSDQIEWILYETPDEHFYYILERVTDNLNSLEISRCNVDNMYRVINVQGLFTEMNKTNFNGQNLVLSIDLQDDFYQPNNRKSVIRFVNGYPQVIPEDSKTVDVEIKLHVSDFSSLFIGAVNASTLYRLGLLGLTNKRYLEKLDLLFMTPNKPLCTVHI